MIKKEGITGSNMQLIKSSLLNAMSYSEYINLVASLAKEDKTTGLVQSDALINYTKLNDRRMKRWIKTIRFSDEVIKQIKSVNQKLNWLVLTESWCGDASPALPVMHKITEINPNISLSILLRDENLELMNEFLTNGALSIPKLIAVDNTMEEVLATWGPRSTKATQLVMDYKQKYGVLSPEFKQNLQVWYNKDKGKSILNDLLQLLSLK